MKLLQPRFLFFVSCIVMVFSLLVFRVVDLQVVQGQTFRAQADDNRFYTLSLPARRGVFLDRYNEALVWNIQRYFQIPNPKALYESRTPISREEALKILSSSQSATIVTDTERLYRYPFALAHVLGYVGEVTAEDLQRDSTLNVGQHIGKAGLEYTKEKEMRGEPGKVVFEIDALAQKLREVQRVEARAGQDIQTSLDPYLTEQAHRGLQGLRGTVIVTDVETGKILALSSQPTFDPNILSQTYADKDKEAERKKQVQGFFQHPDKLFFNRAISGAYPPGSVFKIVTSYAGLENDKIDQNTQVVDEGRIKVGEFEFGNWYYRQYGRVEGAIELTRALGRSNDIYFYKVAEWTGPENLASMARMFGLGDKTGIELPAEARGLVPDPKWKEEVRGEKWYLGNSYHFGIGQGDVLTSPIQIAQMMQAVANNGRLCTVSLLENSDQKCREINLKTEDTELVFRGLLKACSAGGTAYPFFPYNQTRYAEEKSVSENLASGAALCKTGTAEFGGQDEKGYRRTHGWFVVYVNLPEFKRGESGAVSPASQGSESAEVSSLASASATLLATESATATEATTSGSVASTSQLYQKWRSKVEKHGFPRKIAITVLVESDETQKFREGSRDAAPIAKKLVDWMIEGKE